MKTKIDNEELAEDLRELLDEKGTITVDEALAKAKRKWFGSDN